MNVSDEVVAQIVQLLSERDAARAERDAARAALLELAMAVDFDGDVFDGAALLRAALDAAFAIVDPSGERRGGN